jgi:hypothetical protein
MKYYLCTLSTLIFVSLSVSAQKVGIQPSILEFHVVPGVTESQVIRISNTSDTKVSFQAYLADWLRDSTGAHHYYNPAAPVHHGLQPIKIL